MTLLVIRDEWTLTILPASEMRAREPVEEVLEQVLDRFTEAP